MSSFVDVNGNLDGGYSWLVVLGSFLTQFVVMGVHNVFGLLYINLLEEFGESNAATVWVGSVAFGLMLILGPITCSVCTKFGCRAAAIFGGFLFGFGLLCSSFVDNIYKMFLTYSLLFSTGCSLCYYSSVLVLSEYFSKKLVLANGLGLAGAGVGTLALAPFVEFLQSQFHWRVTVKILSALSVVLVVSGLLKSLVPSPTSHVMVTKETEKKRLDFSMLKNKAYLVWVMVVSLVLFGFYIPYVHLVRYCQDLNISKDKAAVLVGCISFAQTLGKIFYGRVSDSPRVNRVYLFQLCLLICSVLTFLLPVLTSFEALMAYCWLFGFNNGCFVIHEAVLTRDIVGPGKFAPAYGVMYFIAGLPMMIGPPAAGWIYQINQTYNPAFFMAGAFTTTGVCLMCFVPLLLPPEVKKVWIRRSNRIQTESDSSVSVISSVPGTKSSYPEFDTESNMKELDVKELADLQFDTESPNHVVSAV